MLRDAAGSCPLLCFTVISAELKNTKNLLTTFPTLLEKQKNES